MWYVYVLKSFEKQFTYIGSTNDVFNRLKQHNAGLTPSTKPYAPFKLVLYIALETKKQARELEKYFKTGSGKAVLYKRLLGSNSLGNEALA